jgi:enamine deaminase RidA (YjgF/YER057c/UK114 family)
VARRARGAGVASPGGRPLTRRLVSSGGPFEAAGGYSRAVAVGDACSVAGTTDAGPDGESRHPGDPAAQARASFDIARIALEEAGFSLRDVVRTRMYVTQPSHAAVVVAVHGELFRDIRPAATIVVVAGLLRASLLVEVELDALRG